MRLAFVTLALLGGLAVRPAAAHDVWANGVIVPGWVKSACCGPDDAHHLRPEQVHRVSDDYYTVDGYRYRIPARAALPSQDGDYWIFYRDDGSGGQSTVYCFFVPMGF
ncbi:hypothetical protein [Roseiarcus sp.]|jgi:hypothetical protein|uniref:hypothetical protein n=1 Tax=Roseiarcus sp. TaxID=1969460 RepID=UPI003F979EDF